jgi:predicted SprT family Zn-dependent metalloprotease
MLSEGTVAFTAAALMEQHGLIEKGWTFGFIRTKTTIGRCSYRHKQILYSVHFLHATFDQMKDTILHEIAHALTPGAGHGRGWKDCCERIGAEPKACKPLSAKPKYRLTCPRCLRSWGKHRLRYPSYLCRGCNENLDIVTL